jgi:UDP-N-acetylmuramoyl-tripeptide--D-alanyl-D-alanine ligase
MKTDWTPEHIARICNGKVLSSTTNAITGFSTDTRTLKPGNIYIALSGENFNGHQFVEKAFANRACAAIISEDINYNPKPEDCLIKVKDSLHALQKLAAHYRNQHQGIFIGVTGSNGKTTTRAMIAHLISNLKNCHSTSGNLNNHIGLPLTILGTPQNAEYVILEMGMNHSGEIRHLCSIAKPDAAIVSNIGPAHIGLLGSLENIAKAKAEIFEKLCSNSFAIAPSDTAFTDIFTTATSAPVVTFGQNPNSDYRIDEMSANLNGISFRFSALNTPPVRCELKLAGKHNIFNAAAALTMYHCLGFNLTQGVEQLKSFTPVGARMETVKKDGVNIILDCYNANPGSTEAAIEYLSNCSKPRIAVLGDMKELGELSKPMHIQVGKKVALMGIDTLLAVGPEAVSIADGAIEAGMDKNSVIALNSSGKAADLLRERIKAGTTILFKASRGMHFEKIVQNIWPDLAEDLH